MPDWLWRWLRRGNLSRRRVEEVYIRAEMDRHPVERLETWHGLEEPHFPLGRSLRPGDVAKRPVFGRGA